ncbi:MAG: Uma2 family endonuclease [Planctomycetota bacterium]
MTTRTSPARPDGQPSTAPDRMTADEFLRFPFPDGTRWELIDNHPTLMVFDDDDNGAGMNAPSIDHQRVVTAVVAAWQRTDPSSAQREVLSGPIDLRLGEQVLQPDALCLAAGVVPAGAQEIADTPLAVAEVLSPRTGSTDITTKYQLYRKAGIQEYWVVDPVSCELFLHVLAGSRYVRQNPDEEGFCESPLFGRRVRVLRHGASYMVDE